MVTQPNVPQGDRALGLQLTVPKGDQTLLEQQGVSQGDRALGVQQSVSQGDRVLSMQPVVPPSDRALGVQLNVPPGDRALGVQQSVPPGDRAYFEQQMRTSNDWPAPFSLREGSSGRSGTVQFEVEQEVESSGLRHADGPTNYPFSGLLQGDVCGGFWRCRSTPGPFPSRSFSWGLWESASFKNYKQGKGQFHLLRLLEYIMALRLRHRLQRALPRDKEWVQWAIPWRPWLRA